MDPLRRSPPLPNEILHYITEYIAYSTPNPYGSIDLGSRPINKSLFKHASPELLALSVVNWRLRRVSLPFLLAHIKIRHDKDAKKLEKDLALCAQFAKTLVIGAFGALTEDGEKIVSQIVPQLEQLLEVELPDCWDRSDLLRIILALPTVTSVLVDEVPNVSMRTHDLSKIILAYSNSTSAFSPQFATYFDQGMRLKCLHLDTDSVGSRLESQNFPGLEEINVSMYKRVISFSWLSPLSSTHPTLTGLWLLNIDQESLAHNAVPFLSSLVEESQRQNLQNVFRISGVSLRRVQPIDQSFHDWRIMGLALKTTSAHKILIEILVLVASVLPKLEFLTLGLRLQKATYDIDELASAIAPFSSLRFIELESVYGLLDFGPGNERTLRDSWTNLPVQSRARAESGLLLLTSYLVKKARSLDSVYIDDVGYEPDNSSIRSQSWCLRGWLHVLNSNCYYSPITQAPELVPSSCNMDVLTSDKQDKTVHPRHECTERQEQGQGTNFKAAQPLILLFHNYNHNHNVVVYSNCRDSMRPYSSLPNELLHAITEYIAFTIDLSDSYSSYSLYKHASPELLALSVVNWRLRRICLPFLFANIKVRHDEDVTRLEKDLPLCAKLTKTLSIDHSKGSSSDLTEAGQQNLSQILPRLEQLLVVELPDCWDRTDLLRTMLVHPTVTSVLVNEIPNSSMANDDLSKLIYGRKMPRSGMRLMSLRLNSIDDRLESQKFPGLQEIKIHYTVPASFSWVPPLLSNHPTLNELWLLQLEHDFFAHDAPPTFLSSLVDLKESQGKDLQHFLSISELGLRRARPINGSFKDWHIIALGLEVKSTFDKKSWMEILRPIPLIFPKLEVLRLDFYARRSSYDIDDLASILARFSSLRVLYLNKFFGGLSLEFARRAIRQVQQDGSTGSPELRARVESVMLLSISRLVKGARALESIHINDSGFGYVNYSARHWNVIGWIHVLNGNRDISGKLTTHFDSASYSF
ncbi:hypothetical protein EV360DRAFT_86319 [Lentinula raphanica]|nr:hypothetical protein EV360DRAFT_86319 [Lentinula raphanica]